MQFQGDVETPSPLEGRYSRDRSFLHAKSDAMLAWGEVRVLKNRGEGQGIYYIQ